MADALGPYRRKRNFGKTSEPAGSIPAETGSRFVIHRHSATAPHYDLRLEHNGVLLSWAIPKGPSLNPTDKRLAVHTEDHPVEYIDFEGVIPEGEYGGGPMIVWDTGTWAPMGDPDEGLATGDFKFRLWGEKLKGGWMLARLKPKPGDNGKDNWLFFKEHDQAVDTTTNILEAGPESVKTGRLIEELVVVRKPPRPTAAAGAVKGPMPTALEPQLATAAEAPPKSAAKGPGYLHEIKFDGYRTLAFLEDGKVRLVTRAGLDWTHRYGLLPQAFAQLPARSAILDGEIVVLDERGVSHFSLLQEALSTGPGSRLTFYAFDLLYLDGWDLRRVPLKKRKEYLSQLIAGVAGGRSAIQFSDHVEGDGEALFERASEMGLEGIVSKREDSLSSPGRTSLWIKAKARQVEDVLIAGYTTSAAAEGLAALAAAEWVDGELRYIGKIGTGFDGATQKSLEARLAALADGGVPLEGAPREVKWVRPVLHARVHYSTRTADGMLRHAVFMGLREAELTAQSTGRKRLVTDADLASVSITNPTRRLFGRNGPTKLDIAVYYAAVGDFMLPHILNRPVSLVRCPTGLAKDCFYQRHAFKGMPRTINVFETQNSDEEDKTYLTIEDARGYLALPQFGGVEFHTWGTHLAHLEKPDRIVFDLDPGEGVEWREIVEAAVHLRGELESIGLVPFVKTSGRKGLHLVVPLKPLLGWKTVHAATGTIATLLARTAPETFVAIMGKDNRKRRIFIDFHRNARSATAAAPYTLRGRPHLPVSTPLDWRDLESIDDPADLNYSSVPGLLTMSGDPWAGINESACELPAQLTVGK